MLTMELGRRYERLLFFTAPISLLCLIVLFIALASNKQKDLVDARCLAETANLFENNRSKLAQLWGDQFDKSKKEHWDIHYVTGLHILMIHGEVFDCSELVESIAREAVNQTPVSLIKNLRTRSSVLRNKPISFYGIEIPEKATFSLFGTNIKIGLATVDQMLKIGLAPLLMLWLGSIYNTRYRETLAIGEAPTIFEVFPHVVNVYPVGNVVAPKKRDRYAPMKLIFARTLFCVTRIALVAIFTVPPVAAYLISLVLQPLEFSLVLTVIVGFFVFMSGLMTLVVEILPWHFRRIFPSPEISWN